MFRGVDIEVDDEGDLVAAAGGDIKLASPQRTLQQDVAFRVRTDHLDYTPVPFLGANLTQFVGDPNTERTGQRIVENITVSLSRDPIVPPGTYFIDAVPVGINKVAAFVVYTGPIDGSKDTSVIVSHTIELDNTGVDNESLINTTVL
jgi:hypothetical protein